LLDISVDAELVSIQTPGAPGVYSFRVSTVNSEDDYLYYKDEDFPVELINGASYIYSGASGSIIGIPNGSLVYAQYLSTQALAFLDIEDSPYSFDGGVSGQITLNDPVVVDSILNINIPTPSNQAVKYYTTGTPLTGLVNGETYFLKNVSADFTGTTSLYDLTNNTHTFTTCGQTGRVGPSSSQILSGYSTNWHSQYIQQGAFQGYQDWTVPVSGIYEFDVRGASGFEGTASLGRTITQTSLTNNVATITTNVAHGFVTGRNVTIVNATNAVYNGTRVITSTPTTTTFTFAITNAIIPPTASSGTATSDVSSTAGRGARIVGRVSLTKGEIITVVVGQRGASSTSGSTYGGSGGGSFVVRKSGNEPLFVAGGGSSDASTTTGRDGQTTIRGGVGSSGRPGGEDGFGGPSTNPAAQNLTQQGRSGGGGGFASRGEDAVYTTSTAFNAPRFTQPGGGGFSDGLTAAINTRTGGAGGFGGGASGNVEQSQSGGAGGFSGGAGSRDTGTNSVGGGGGSFISRSAQNIKTSNGQYDELPTFNNQAIENLNSYRVGDGTVRVDLVQAFTSGNTIHPTAIDAENGTNAIAIQPAGNSYHAFVPISYDIQRDRIYFISPHGFDNGQAISFNLAFTSPDLNNVAVYYVNKIDDFTIGLVYSPAVNFTVPTIKSSSDTIKRIVVNLDLDSLNIPTHGFSVDQPIQYSTGGGNPIVPLQDGVTYYVSEVIDPNNIRLKIALDAPTPINFEEAGTGTSHSFIFLTVNFTENTLYIPSHRLVSGQAIRYTTNGGAAIGGLTNNTTYFVIRVDDSTIRLSSTEDLLNVVNLSTVGAGTHSLFITSINFASNTLTIPQHGFLQGELVEYDARGQDEIEGLDTGQTYYVIFVNGNNLRLATSRENAHNGIAIDILESPAAVGRHTLTSLSQTPDGIYSVESVPTDDTFTVLARGQVPTLLKQFNPRSTVDVELDALFFPSHGFVTGTKLLYSIGDGAAIQGLTNNTQYYAVVINQDYFRLASSLDNALAGIKIDLGNFGSGVSHSFTSNQLNGSIVGSGNVSVESGSVLVNGDGTSFSKILKVGDPFTLYPPNATETLVFGSSNVNTGNNRIEIDHNFSAGDFVRFSTGGGVAPTPLINNYYYYVGVVDATSIQLFTSRAAAIALTSPVSFSSSGTGSAFSLTNTVPAGPIVRRITAVGSDFQVTVDRPYAVAYNEVSYAYPTFMYVRPSGYSLHRPFDGGVEMSTGSGNWFGQIIRQTRKYFRYQSGKGIQTSFAITFKPSIDIESMERFSATQIEVKTRRPHNLVSGLFINVAEAENSSGNTSTLYNGSFQVTVVDLTTFRVISRSPVPTGVEARAYGFPQFHVTSWQNGAIRSGMFDFQNGMFFEFDGQKLYCVRRSSTQQTAGTVSALRGSELIFGDKTKFTAQFDEGDYIVLRGQTYRIIDIQDDVTLSIRPEYRGSTGLEITFDPGLQLNLATDTFNIVRHGLSQNLPLVYNSIDGEPLGGLINGRTYYADVIDANSFRLLANPSAGSVVNVSSIGTTDTHSFVPAKSGIIVTKTVDTKVPQEEWNIDRCDGTGPSGYNLDLSKIQMCYMDFSWYGAGKIRYGFKVGDGLVKYVHEFKHNNILFESYFRSGNLPARYEVITFENPTYVPSLFHWGTSVIMDGTFDDDRGYLFTAGSQTLSIEGTTTKSFAGAGIDLQTDLITSLTHGFRTGDIVQFQSIAADGLPGDDVLNPRTRVVGSNTEQLLKNTFKYKVFVNNEDRIHLSPQNAKITVGAKASQQGQSVLINTISPHEIENGFYIGVYGSSKIPESTLNVTSVPSTTTLGYSVPAGAGVLVNISNTILQSNFATITTSIPHGFVTGDRIFITGTNNTTYNGSYVVESVPTPTTLRYSRPNANINSSTSGGTISILKDFLPSVAISSTVLTSNIATITTSVAHGFSAGQTVTIAGASNTIYNGTYQIISIPAVNQFSYERINANIGSVGSSGTATVTIDPVLEPGLFLAEILDFETVGNSQYTYFLHPNGSLNNTTGPNYQPLISLRLSPSADSGLTGKLGDRDIINRMQVRMQEIGVSTDELVEVKLILNGRLNNLGFVPVDQPSLVELVEHTPQDTISGGIQIYNFQAEPNSTNNLSLDALFELSNSILGGDNIFPDGPDILTVAVSRLSGNETRSSAKLSWSEAQA